MMAARIPKSNRRVRDLERSTVWVKGGVCLDQAARVRTLTNSRKGPPILHEGQLADSQLAEELTLAAGDVGVCAEVKANDLNRTQRPEELRQYLDEVEKAARRLADVMDQMGEAAYNVLHQHGAFQLDQAEGDGMEARGHDLAGVILSGRVRTLQQAAEGARDKLKGARPKKKDNQDAAVWKLADIYAKASGRNPSAKDTMDTPFSRFADAALPLLGVNPVSKEILRRVLSERQKLMADGGS